MNDYNAYETVALSKTSYTYDGKEKKPGVTVTDWLGDPISKSEYTVSYLKRQECRQIHRDHQV